MICKDCKYFRKYIEESIQGSNVALVWAYCTEPTNCRVEDFVLGHTKAESVSCYDKNDKGQCKNGEPREEKGS